MTNINQIILRRSMESRTVTIPMNISYRGRTLLHSYVTFSNYAPTLWNNLPVFIRSSPSLPRFHSALKTHLFREAFNIWFPCFNRESYQRPWSFVTYGKGALQIDWQVCCCSPIRICAIRRGGGGINVPSKLLLTPYSRGRFILTPHSSAFVRSF